MRGDSDSWCNKTIEFDRKRAANRSLASGCIECGREAPQRDEQRVGQKGR